MKTPFVNDPFAIVWLAFKELYPDKECQCYWDPEKQSDEAYGFTEFNEANGEVTVFVTSSLPVENTVEILAHELAHVAVGYDHGHDEAWESAFDAIFAKYNEIADDLFLGKGGDSDGKAD